MELTTNTTEIFPSAFGGRSSAETHFALLSIHLLQDRWNGMEMTCVICGNLHFLECCQFESGAAPSITFGVGTEGLKPVCEMFLHLLPLSHAVSLAPCFGELSPEHLVFHFVAVS